MNPALARLRELEGGLKMLLKLLVKKHPKILLDSEDFENYKYCEASLTNCGYITLSYKGKPESLHRAVMGFPNLHVDHINKNKLDNRKINLRLCTHSQNMANKELRSTNTSGYKGVIWYKPTKKWRATIKAQGKFYHLGYYRTKEAAALAYNKKALEVFGEFAHLNKIEEKRDESGTNEIERVGCKETLGEQD